MANRIAFLTSLMIASVAAFFSILGLSTIFSGAFWAIVIMGAALEVGKLVTSAWLHIKWNEIGSFLKYYLTAAVVILMLITSMGIFGLLSKAHLQQESILSGVEIRLESVREKITDEDDKVAAINRQLSSLDGALEEYIERGYITRGLTARQEQTDQRTLLESTRDDISIRIEKLKEVESTLRLEVLGAEAEIGAVKYITELLYGDDAKNHYADAVRSVILSLIFVFDPLAIVLLLASTKAISEEPKKVKVVKKTGALPKSNREEGQEEGEEELIESVDELDVETKIKKPRWAKNAIATTKGWISTKGELLKTQKMTEQEVKHFNGN
jgi:hypothetical protein